MTTTHKIGTMLTILLAFSTLHKTLGLKCFMCEYWGDHGDEGCQLGPPPPKYLQDCKSGQCSVLFARDKGKIYTQRGCVKTTRGDNMCINTSFKESVIGTHPNYRGTACYCDEKDGCNKGWTLGPTRIALSLTAIAFLVKPN